jgi:hypothetical protein
MPKLHPGQLVVPELTAGQVNAYATWYEGRFGVQLTREEAVVRLSHLAQLFLLLDGASWIEGQKSRITKL